jgi:C4-dicarboxylate transporter DctM subunit
MSIEPQTEETVVPDGYALVSGWIRFWHGAETTILVAALAVMTLLPVLEVILRSGFDRGIAGMTVVVQHLVLVVGMVGSAVAARKGRLLSLSTLTVFLKGRWKQAAHIVSHGIAAGITIFLTIGSIQFAWSTRQLDKTVIFDLPTWIVQLIIPAAFGLIAFRLWWQSGKSWKIRSVSGLLIVALTVTGLYPPAEPEYLAVAGLAVVLGGIVLGAPIYAGLGGAALVLFWSDYSPIASLALDHYRLVVNPSLPAIPLFTLAGYFLAEGGASKRLIRVFKAVVGSVRGGPALVAVLVCAFFTTFTGASGVTILALGGLLLPALTAAKIRERDSIGLLTASGSLGILFPPCLPLILYALVATNAGSHVELGALFLGGILPGLLLVGITAGWGIYRAPRVAAVGHRFDGAEALAALWDAKWELLLPVVALGSLFGGFATPVEAAALTAFYCFVVETIFYRDLRLFNDLPRVLTECGLLVGGVLLILGVAMGFTNYLVDAQIPDIAVAWATETIKSPWVFLLALNGFLILVGCLMDVYSAIIVVVPLIVPVAHAFGINPMHLGIIFLANLELGFLTPPVGMNLFLSSYRFGKSVPIVIQSVAPLLLLLAIGVLIITYVPGLSLFLPGLLQ